MSDANRGIRCSESSKNPGDRPMTQQPNPNELLLITREELERCCSQMSAAGYKVSANYVEASVLSRSRPTAQVDAPEMQKCKICGNVLEYHNDSYLWCKNMHAFRYFPIQEKQHDTAIRNRMLDEIIQWSSQYANKKFTSGMLGEYIASLRHIEAQK